MVTALTLELLVGSCLVAATFAQPMARAAPTPRAELVLFDNGAVNPNAGLDVVAYSIGEDFEVSSNAWATGALFYIADDSGPYPTWDGILRWWICSDDGGVPGAPIAQGVGVDLNWQFLGSTTGWDYYLLAFNFGASVPLSAAIRYWLALHLNRTWGYGYGFYWLRSSAGHFSWSVYDQIGFGDWTQNTGAEQAFSIVASTEVTYIFTDGFELGDTSMWSATQP